LALDRPDVEGREEGVGEEKGEEKSMMSREWGMGY
jgi:hypothetical protein